jgi:hypothetical protein
MKNINKRASKKRLQLLIRERINLGLTASVSTRTKVLMQQLKALS